ncbi:hypothetical protein HY251_13765 [bacterium]|nr:hypothetical protein [bacterium]
MGHHLTDLDRLPKSELEHLLRHGETPDFAALDGFLFRGANLAFPGSFLFRKFVKGFFTEGRADGRRVSMGYNLAAEKGSLDEPWKLLPETAKPRPFGFYECRVVRAGERRSYWPGSLLLDYARGGNGLRPESLLQDFLVQVEGGNKDLYLGKAYLALGAWLPAGYFALERWRQAPPEPPR